MLQFCKAYLRHRKLVATVFAVVVLACAVCIPQVKVNYSMTDYLPADSPSVQALNDMEEAFGAGTVNARLYAEGVDIAQASQLADDLAAIDGIDEVMWLGSVVDIRQPIETIREDTAESWVTDDGYLYQLAISDDLGMQASEQARTTAERVGSTQVSLSGNAITTASAQASTSMDVVIIMLVAVLIIIAILLLVSHSWFEPVIFLTVIGAAIIMNMGTNLIMGEISFISQICGAILQLAVSMDYAIVLLHTYNRCLKEFPDPEEAMAHAMVRGASVVLSSAAVTFFGFLSLTLMRFGLGANMGIVLSKGIVFSFLSIMLLMPCLVLMCRRPLEKLEHRYLVPSFNRLANGCQRIMIPMAIVVVIVAVPAYLAESRTSFIYGSSDFASPESQIGQEAAHINEAFGEQESWVVMVPEGYWAQEQELLDNLKALPEVSSATSYITVAGRALPVEVAREEQLEQVVSNGWSRIVLTLDVSSDDDTTFNLVETVRNLSYEQYDDDYRLIGNTVSIYDLRNTVHEDSATSKLFSMAAIGLVLALMFKSLTIPLVCLISIEVAIWMNLAVPYFLGDTLNYTGYLVIDAVQLGAAVDYSIIYAREYFDQRREHSPKDAARLAIEHGGVPIMTSALILTFAGVAVWLIASNGVISQLGVLVARGAFLSMIMMFVFLPCLFRTFDWIIRHTTLGLHVCETPKAQKKEKAHV